MPLSRFLGSQTFRIFQALELAPFQDPRRVKKEKKRKEENEKIPKRKIEARKKRDIIQYSGVFLFRVGLYLRALG